MRTVSTNMIFSAWSSTTEVILILASRNKINGGVEEFFAEDTYKAATWLTLMGGFRQSNFPRWVIGECFVSAGGRHRSYPQTQSGLPRVLRPLLQPPPLTTISGPALQYATGNNTGFVPLQGERDEEHQFGVQIPWRGWLLDADTFETRANNFLDHSNIGESSIFVPVTVQGALIQGLGAYPTFTLPMAFRAISSGVFQSNCAADWAGHGRADLLSP